MDGLFTSTDKILKKVRSETAEFFDKLKIYATRF